MQNHTVQAIQAKIIRLPNRPPFMLTKDLAELYETSHKQISQAVLRNPERFPADFCFDLTAGEIRCLQNEDNISKQLLSAKQRGFTRFGANMLSAVLKSNVAASRCVDIMRAFSLLEESAQKPGTLEDLLDGLFGKGFAARVSKAVREPQDAATVTIPKDAYIELLEIKGEWYKAQAGQQAAPGAGLPQRPQRRGGRTTEDEKALICSLKLDGWPNQAIARHVGRSDETVRRVVREGLQ